MQRNTDHPRLQPIPFNAANFAGVGTITGWTLTAPDQIALDKLVLGNVMKLLFNLENTTIAGVADTTIRFILPAGEPLPLRTMNLGGLYCKLHGIAAGAFVPVRALVTAGSRNIDLLPLHGQAIYTSVVITNPVTGAEGQAINDALAVLSASPGSWIVGVNDTDLFGELTIPIG